MKDLIEALQIFLKYSNSTHPTHCEHDALYVMIDPSLVSAEDKARLGELGFREDTEYGDCFMSFRYGST